MKHQPTSYDYPEYYEIAFSFRDIPHEVDTMEQCLQRYADNPGKRVLELACGPCPHMIELHKRGYHYTGIDINESMLSYSHKKASASGIPADLVKASMIDFRLPVKSDLVFVALGSLYVTNTAEMNMHFDSVAGALKRGGLYLLDWCIQFALDKIYSDAGDSWETTRDNVRVRTTVRMTPVDYVEQLFEEHLALEIDDNGVQRLASSRLKKRVIFPQELLAFLKSRSDFEFIGWWNNWDLSRPLSSASNEISRPITLLRRT